MITNRVFDKLITDMSIHAQNDYPCEACGLITSDFIYIPCKNISGNKKDNFILDPLALLEYEDSAVGIFHSHPGIENPLPSEEDIAHTVFDCYFYIVGWGSKFFIYWYDKKKKVMMYEPFGIEHCRLK